MSLRVEEFMSGCGMLDAEIAKDEAAGRMTAGTAAALRLQLEVLEKLYRTAMGE